MWRVRQGEAYSCYREVAISGSFAMNRFHFIVLLFCNLSTSSLHISLFFWWGEGVRGGTTTF